MKKTGAAGAVDPLPADVLDQLLEYEGIQLAPNIGNRTQPSLLFTATPTKRYTYTDYGVRKKNQGTNGGSRYSLFP